MAAASDAAAIDGCCIWLLHLRQLIMHQTSMAAASDAAAIDGCCI